MRIVGSHMFFEIFCGNQHFLVLIAAWQPPVLTRRQSHYTEASGAWRPKKNESTAKDTDGKTFDERNDHVPLVV